MTIEGGNSADAGALGAGNQVGLGEIEPITLVDLDRRSNTSRSTTTIDGKARS